MLHEERYWRTLIILIDKEHKKKLKTIGDNIGLSPAKILGKLVDNFVTKYEVKRGH